MMKRQKISYFTLASLVRHQRHRDAVVVEIPAPARQARIWLTGRLYSNNRCTNSMETYRQLHGVFSLAVPKDTASR
jgi:hypothetical protein